MNFASFFGRSTNTRSVPNNCGSCWISSQNDQSRQTAWNQFGVLQPALVRKRVKIKIRYCLTRRKHTSKCRLPALSWPKDSRYWRTAIGNFKTIKIMTAVNHTGIKTRDLGGWLRDFLFCVPQRGYRMITGLIHERDQVKQSLTEIR